ncbi:MAG: hypothetical protein ACLQG3_02570 [Terracidiphilus sp.]
MKARSILLLLLFAFVAGVFSGIWMDWSVWKNKVGVQDIRYLVQNYASANLQVHAGDSITLLGPDGGNKAGLQMNFVGYSPCVDQTPSGTCTIAADSTPGPYFFTCSSSSGDGYSCPDPAIQQSPTGPIWKFSFARAVETDFAHLVGGQHPSKENPEPAKTNSGPPAASAITAYVSCQGGNTVLQDLNGNSETTITASTGQSVFWISSKPFSLTTSGFPAGLCSNGNPGGSNLQEAKCAVALGGQNLQYGVQAQTTPTSCTALNANLKTK